MGDGTATATFGERFFLLPLTERRVRRVARSLEAGSLRREAVDALRLALAVRPPVSTTAGMVMVTLPA